MTASDLHSSLDCDIAIVGAGPVGLALASWLARRGATAQLSVCLLDARPPHAALDDPRALALSHGSRILLEPVGWPRQATAIERIHVSQRGSFGRALIEHDEHDVPALGYVVRYGALVGALADGAARAGVDVTLASATASAQHAQGVTLTLDANGAGKTLNARVLVNAEGGLFRTSEPVPRRLASGIAKHQRDYEQTAIVGVVTVSAPQRHTAWERFTHAGPLALLPLDDSTDAARCKYALVWCGEPEHAQRRLALSDEAFLAELGEAFGARMGRFTSIAGRAAFPLGLIALAQPVDGRTVAIGNAAQTLHPVAGQGLNLGLRDAHTLVDSFAKHGATPEALADFAKRRTLDRRLTIGLTDTMARAFTIDLGPLAGLRGLALAALDLAPSAKRALARHMMFGQRR
ncbi:UbiH/UbiF/VisC/COQ6 family ubiquinone biosynthesis hydroxylase [Pararobbsia alpina]|uniref:2-octaprenyl-6-methoxyphenol hydroxylase n=1 Tax=Pararobbsia alpina TaxID=621374 RepID=A0A6S7B743_9BURK|nr:UbiH/UbiF/VisC/COQ6 family ubiquinone biosynthesis hydroxylase [Pararobbsia alpina]CAB3779747.1 2-octaprenyl-6-methoxyphenol hydroxylase [Pararobbsia alpina]